MRNITLCSFKGGTAKTSTALSVGACFAKDHNKKVLLVDFDSQANLSIGLGIGPDSEQTMVPVIQGTENIKNVIQKTGTKNLFLIPANAYLDGIESTASLIKDLNAHLRLRDALKLVEDQFDYCFIDTPPSLGWLTQSALFASQYNIVCATPEAYSVLGLRRLKEFQEYIKKYHTIDVLGVVLSLWDERGALNMTFLEEINASFPQKLLNSKIRRDVSVSRAVLQGKPIIEYAPDCRASQDFYLLSKELLGRLDLFLDEKTKLMTLSKSNSKVRT